MLQKKPLTTIGRAENIDLLALDIKQVSSRIDTGARTSAIWASNIVEHDSTLEFTLFDTESRYYTGQIIATKDFSQIVVASSNGHPEIRYKVKLSVMLHGRRIKASFTLANRSKQTYPVLIGRNILRGKFIVNVSEGTPLLAEEQKRIGELQKLLNSKKGVV